jgi:hypothetical protein
MPGGTPTTVRYRIIRMSDYGGHNLCCNVATIFWPFCIEQSCTSIQLCIIAVGELAHFGRRLSFQNVLGCSSLIRQEVGSVQSESPFFSYWIFIKQHSASVVSMLLVSCALSNVYS